MDLEKAANLLTQLTPVRLETALCLKARSAKATCRACVEVCPERVLTLDRGPRLDDGCSSCGLCVTACPTGVFRLERPSDATLLAQAGRAAADPVIFACPAEAAKLAGEAVGRLVTVPCIGLLSAEVLAGVLAGGHRRLLLWRPPACDGCARAAGAAIAAAEAEALNRLIPGSVVVGAPAPLPPAEATAPDRGGAATGLGGELAAACSRLCPSGALQLADEGEQRSLLWEARRCSDCGLCRETCPLQAMTTGEQVTVGRVRNRAPERLALGRRTVCECGAEYWRVEGGPDRCAACRMRSARVTEQEGTSHV